MWYAVSRDNVCSNLIERGLYETWPVNIGGDGTRPGDLYLWQSEIDGPGRPPTHGQIIDALASKDARVRSVARNYIEWSWRVVEKDKLVSEATTTEKGIWTAVGALSWARTRPVGWGRMPASGRLRKALQDDQELADKPGLKALAALESARVTEDTTFLEQVAKRPLSASEITEVKPDMTRILLGSELCSESSGMNPQWAGFSKAEIEGLPANLFSLLKRGKTYFALVAAPPLRAS